MSSSTTTENKMNTNHKGKTLFHQGEKTHLLSVSNHKVKLNKAKQEQILIKKLASLPASR